MLQDSYLHSFLCVVLIPVSSTVLESVIVQIFTAGIVGIRVTITFANNLMVNVASSRNTLFIIIVIKILSINFTCICIAVVLMFAQP